MKVHALNRKAVRSDRRRVSANRKAMPRLAKSIIGTLGERFQSRQIPPRCEWDFHRVPQHEVQACLNYEISRERAVARAAIIRRLATDVQLEATDEGNKLNRLSDLQSELDACDKYSRPWLVLTTDEKATFIASAETLFKPPVKCVSTLSAAEKLALKLSKTKENLEIAVDWSQSDKQIEEAFSKLVAEQRSAPGTIANRTPGYECRGPKPSSQYGLFCLAVWRLRMAGRSPKVIRNHMHRKGSALAPPAPEVLEKKVAVYFRQAERTLLKVPRYFLTE